MLGKEPNETVGAGSNEQSACHRGLRKGAQDRLVTTVASTRVPQVPRKRIIQVDGSTGVLRSMALLPHACRRSPEVEIVEPAQSFEVLIGQTGLWTLPDLWKAQTARFPQVLGRRQGRAAHRPHRPGCDSLSGRNGSKMSSDGTEEVTENTTKRRFAPISVHDRRTRCSPSSGTSVHHHRNTHDSTEPAGSENSSRLFSGKSCRLTPEGSDNLPSPGGAIEARHGEAKEDDRSHGNQRQDFPEPTEPSGTVRQPTRGPSNNADPSESLESRCPGEVGVSH